MEENQQEAQNQSGRHYAAPALFTAIFVVVYFLFPVIIVLPVVLVYGNNSIPRYVDAPLTMALYPIRKLNNIPAYQKMVYREFKWLGMPDNYGLAEFYGSE